MPLSRSRVAWACLVLVASFLLSFLPLVLHPSVAQGDEIFQASEQAHRLVFGYGTMTWEFAFGARSWILALLSAGPMAIAKALHTRPPLSLPLIAALFSAIGAVASLCVFLKAGGFFGAAGAGGAPLGSARWCGKYVFWG